MKGFKFRLLFLESVAILGLYLFPATLVPAQVSEEQEASYQGIEIRSYSGSPLLIHVRIEDSERHYERLEIVSSEAEISYALPEQTSTSVTISPFLKPGVYDLALRLLAEEEVEEYNYRIGFTDYVWGRDNFRFGNNSNFETLHGDYSLALFAWLEERFGDISEADRVLLVHYMYGLFGQNPGRCYAFSASQYRYLTWPELLPRYNDNVYEVRGSSGRIKREMHFLQMDVVFDYFVAGGTLRYGGQSAEDAREQVAEVLRLIREGRPVVAGFVGPELHHSMLIYGYFQRRGSETIDLLVANNWKEDQESNVDNLNAELVRVNLDSGGETPLLEWLGREGLRPRQPTRFFVVDVQEQYDHDRVLLEAHLAGVKRQMQAEGLQLLVVENAASAWLSDEEGNSTGYETWRNVEEIPGIAYQRRKRAHTFEIAADRELELHVEDKEGVRVYFLDPAVPQESWIIETESPDQEVERIIDLATGALKPEAIARDE